MATTKVTVKSYEELVVWQKAMQLAERIYLLTKQMPVDERFGLTAQVRRAAVSVPSNIAEGQGRATTGEFIQFLGNARGSLYEVQTQVQLMISLEYVAEEKAAEVIASIGDVGRLLNGLMNSLR
ncbi:MAG: four helix bundle protein [Nevskia sp.]